MTNEHFVVVLAGKNKGRIGIVLGANRSQRGHEWVQFPSEPFPRDVLSVSLANLRNATAGECARMQSELETTR